MKAFNSIVKRTVSLTLCAVLLMSLGVLSSCSFDKRTVLTINSVNVSNDVFTYFLDAAQAELGAGAVYSDILDRAIKLAESYFKTNSLAHTEGISLSTAEKAGVSKKVGAYWGIYGEYFTKIGVSKETLTKVFTAESYRNALLKHYFGKGGSDEVSESRIYAAFQVNYVVFQSINGYFTYLDESGNTVRLSDSETEAIVLKFQNMAAMLNSGEKNMEQAAAFLAESGYSSSVSNVVLKRDDVQTYPAGFFEKVQMTEPRIATVIGTSSYIFLVVRGSIDTTSSYYTDRRDEIIAGIVGNKIDEKIEASLKTEPDVIDSEAGGLFYLIEREKGL